MTEKISLDEIGIALPERINLFICSSSFEDRCASIAERISSRVDKALIITNNEGQEASATNLARLETLFSQRVLVEASREAPMLTAGAFEASALYEVNRNINTNVLIDITTFTHEQLLILLALLKARAAPITVTMAYTSALEYSFNTTNEAVWLSRGVRQIRSVLGYPGQLVPSKRLHLMILVGFESERAQALIERVEPAKLSLGIGDVKHSVSEAHYAKNEIFFSRVKRFIEHQKRMDTEVETFSFSCINPFDARDAILEQAEKHEDFNTVVCPMNTKISTIGAGLATFVRESIQIAYALPSEYNEEGYSKPGLSATVFQLALK